MLISPDADSPGPDAAIDSLATDAAVDRGAADEALDLADAADAPSADDVRPDVASDARFACGSMTCAPGQFCVTGGGGPAPECFPRADGGACPPDTTPGCEYPQGPGRDCQEIRVRGYRCVDLPASCAAQEPCACICMFTPGSGEECLVNGPQVDCEYP
jgi:hypothetical protein